MLGDPQTQAGIDDRSCGDPRMVDLDIGDIDRQGVFSDFEGGVSVNIQNGAHLCFFELYDFISWIGLQLLERDLLSLVQLGDIEGQIDVDNQAVQADRLMLPIYAAHCQEGVETESFGVTSIKADLLVVEAKFFGMQLMFALVDQNI